MGAQIEKEKVVMKKIVALLFIVGGTLFTAATAHAQSLRVTVPFDFVIDGKTLPAATYTVRESLPNNNTGLAFIGEGHGLLTQATEIDGAVTGTKLVFHRVDGEYFLSDVFTLSGKLHFAASRQEKARRAQADVQSVTILAGN